jgi:hypothetical protein
MKYEKKLLYAHYRILVAWYGPYQKVRTKGSCPSKKLVEKLHRIRLSLIVLNN